MVEELANTIKTPSRSGQFDPDGTGRTDGCEPKKRSTPWRTASLLLQLSLRSSLPLLSMRSVEELFQLQIA